MRNLGRFVGEIGKAVRKPANKPVAGGDTRKRVTESSETVYTDSERVTLTRTTTEEIRIEPLQKPEEQP